MLKTIAKKNAIKPRGKILGVFEDEYYSRFAITQYKNRFYIGKSDAGWLYSQLKVGGDMFISPWPMTEEESNMIKKILIEKGAIDVLSN